MKTLVVFSDTHGSKVGVEKILPIARENSFVVHLGDGLTEIRPFLEEEHSGLRFVCGNCDIYPAPEEGVLEVEGVRIFYCHGHRYGVKTGLDRLAYRAKELNCTVALYGHTHRAAIDEIGGVTLICPGTLRAPTDRGGSYAYVVVTDTKCTVALVGENPR